jgi:hypothetical protein
MYPPTSAVKGVDMHLPAAETGILNCEQHHNQNFKEEKENRNVMHCGCLHAKLYSRIFCWN